MKSHTPDSGTGEDNEKRAVSTIRPNRSLWVMPDGSVADMETEGSTEDGAAFSHGIFVKKWLGFRLGRFHPDKSEVETARRIKARAEELLREYPDLESEPEADGALNPFSGDLAYNQAAEEQGWIRIKPLTRPIETTIYAETLTGEMTAAARRVIEAAAGHCGCRLVILKGGALENRAKEITPYVG